MLSARVQVVGSSKVSFCTMAMWKKTHISIYIYIFMVSIYILDSAPCESPPDATCLDKLLHCCLCQYVFAFILCVDDVLYNG